MAINRREFIGSLGKAAIVVACAPLLPLPELPCSKLLVNERRIWQAWDDGAWAKLHDYWKYESISPRPDWMVDRWLSPIRFSNLRCGTHGWVSSLHCENCGVKRLWDIKAYLRKTDRYDALRQG